MKNLVVLLNISLVFAAHSAPEPATDYVPKTKSSFPIVEPVRNPFWPIGFVPVKKMPNQVVEDQLLRIPIENFRVTSIFSGNPGFAVINGKDYTQGQFLTMATPTGSAKLLITAIEDGYVVVQYRALIAKIPISRK